MYSPSIFNDNFVDDLFEEVLGFPFNFGKKGDIPAGRMITDVHEFEDKYVLEMELPGYDKSDVKIELEDGYLKIEAEHKEDTENKDAAGKIIRKERFTGKCERKFYIGKEVKGDDISAEFKDGILKIGVPKVAEQPKVEKKNYIEIDG